MMKLFRFFIACFLTIVMYSSAFAQAPPANIESMTDQQLIVLMSQYQLYGLTDLELDMKAREKGLSTDQILSLKKRMALLDPNALMEINGPKKSTSDPYEPRVATKTKAPSSKPEEHASDLKVFGANIFENENLSFEPNLNIATPQGYVVGVGDQIVVDVYGVSDLTKRLIVTTEGDIRFPNLGPVKIAGLTIEDARIKMRKALTKIYPGIANGSVSVQISVGQIRSIRVTLIGEIKRPGNYDVSALSTIMNALYASGGPNQIGSFRSIELVRNGKQVVVFDLYDFLLKSDLTKNLLLQDGDVVRVNPYQNRIVLKGAVKKPALFDVKPNETAADIIKYAGGFADMAYKEMIRVYRMGNRNKEILILKANEFPAFKLVSGDTLLVEKLADMYTNRIIINGAVYYPGTYGVNDMPTLRDIINAAKPKEEAFMERGLIRRLKSDFNPEFINFNIKDVIEGKFNISLIREDSIQIYNIKDLREKYTVVINGEVNQSGTYDFSENMTAQDLVLMAKGYKDGASLQKIEIARRIRQFKSAEKDSTVYSVIKEINLLTEDKKSEDLNFKLAPFDIVSVRKSPVYKEQISVTVEGEVVYPGMYTLSGNAERVSDLIKRAGGLKQNGFAGGAILLRKTYRDLSKNDATLINNKTNLINSQSGKAVDNKSISDSVIMSEVSNEQKTVGIKLDKILDQPGSQEDLFLVEGDVLKVPKQLQTIQTFGAVNVPKQIVFYNGISFRAALRESGRYALNASKRNSYVIYPNGQVRKTKSFAFLKFYPRIKPGTEIYVPENKTKPKLSTGEVLGIFSSITSLLGIVVVLINTSK